VVVVVVAAITQCKFSKIAALRCTCMVDCWEVTRDDDFQSCKKCSKWVVVPWFC
jgi:hypothetical protein